MIDVQVVKMEGFPERGGGPPDLAQLQSTMHAIELACASIQVSRYLVALKFKPRVIHDRNPQSQLLRVAKKFEGRNFFFLVDYGWWVGWCWGGDWPFCETTVLFKYKKHLNLLSF